MATLAWASVAGHDGLGHGRQRGPSGLLTDGLEPHAGPGRGGVAAGAVEGLSPAAVASASEVVVICVSDTPDVEAVLFGEDGLADGLAVVRWSSTARPSPRGDARVRRAAGREGIGFVDAPVSGGSEGALKGTLTIMVGGSEADVERARPVLEAMG